MGGDVHSDVAGGVLGPRGAGVRMVAGALEAAPGGVGMRGRVGFAGVGDGRDERGDLALAEEIERWDFRGQAHSGVANSLIFCHA